MQHASPATKGSFGARRGFAGFASIKLAVVSTVRQSPPMMNLGKRLKHGKRLKRYP